MNNLMHFTGITIAYLDPGSGSYILQLILAGLLGALFAVKVFWGKIRSFLLNLFPKQKKNNG